MQIKEERQGEVLIVSVSDYLDSQSSPAFESRFLRLIEEGARQVLLDCSSLLYINSAGLKAFLLGAKQLERESGRLMVCGLAPNVFSIFEVIGFTRILQILPDRSAALQAFGIEPAAS